MKKDIHPKVNSQTKVTCACGNSFVTISTLDEINVEICSNCHPFYTGQQKFVDTEGRIEKFQKKMKLAEDNKEVVSAKKAKKTAKREGKKESNGTSLKDMLAQAKSQ